MRHRSTHVLTIVAAAASLLVLAGCVDSPEPMPTPTRSATPTPQATGAEPTPTPSAPPTAAPDAVDCTSLVPADAFALLMKDFTLVPGYTPPEVSVFTELLDLGGTVCGWMADDATTVAVGVAAIDADAALAKKNELVMTSNSVPTYGVEGYFDLVAGMGEANAFSDPYWILATSTAFMEPGEVAPIIAAVLERLG